MGSRHTVLSHDRNFALRQLIFMFILTSAVYVTISQLNNSDKCKVTVNGLLSTSFVTRSGFKI